MNRRTFIKALGAAFALPLVPSLPLPPRKTTLVTSRYVDPGVYIGEVVMPAEFEYDMRPGHMTHEGMTFPKLRFYDRFGQELDLPIVAADPRTKRVLYITQQTRDGVALVIDRNLPEASTPSWHRPYLGHPYTYEMGDGLFIPLIQRRPITVEVAS